MRQRDVVWVRIPFSDLAREKARPALVVSNDAYNEVHEDVVVCAVTSSMEPGDYKVPLPSSAMERGGLPLPSMVRADKILQIEKSLIGRTLARVNTAAYDQVVQRVQTLIRRQARRR